VTRKLSPTCDSDRLTPWPTCIKLEELETRKSKTPKHPTHPRPISIQPICKVISFFCSPVSGFLSSFQGYINRTGSMCETNWCETRSTKKRVMEKNGNKKKNAHVHPSYKISKDTTNHRERPKKIETPIFPANRNPLSPVSLRIRPLIRQTTRFSDWANVDHDRSFLWKRVICEG